MSRFRKGSHGRFTSKVPTIEFDTIEERDTAVRVLEMFGRLVKEANEDGYAVEPLRERGPTELTVAVFDPPHTKASASGVALLRGAASSASSETSGIVPLDRTWDRNDLKVVAQQMRGLKEQLRSKGGG